MTSNGEAKALGKGMMDADVLAQWCTRSPMEQAQLLGMVGQQHWTGGITYNDMTQVRVLLDALSEQWPKNVQNQKACIGFFRWMYPDRLNATPMAAEALFRLPGLAAEIAPQMNKRTTTTSSTGMPKSLGEICGAGVSAQAILWLWEKQWLAEDEWSGLVRSWLTTQRDDFGAITEVVRPMWGDKMLGGMISQYGNDKTLKCVDIDWTGHHGWFLLNAHLHRNFSAISFLEQHIDPLSVARNFFGTLNPQQLFGVALNMLRRMHPNDECSAQMVALINHHTMKNNWKKVLNSSDHHALREHMKAITHNKKLVGAVRDVAQSKAHSPARKM